MTASDTEARLAPGEWLDRLDNAAALPLASGVPTGILGLGDRYGVVAVMLRITPGLCYEGVVTTRGPCHVS